MHEILYIILMLSVSPFVILCFINSLHKHSPLAKVFSKILIFALVLVFSYVPALFCDSEKLSSILYSVYFISNTWLCLMICKFSRVYIHKGKLSNSVKIAGYMVIIADTVSHIINPFTFHEATFSRVNNGSFEFWMFKGHGVFNIHLLICYILFGMFVFNFLSWTITAPKLYKMQYAVALIMLSMCVGGNAIFLLFDVGGIDISIVLYSLTGTLIYYFTFDYLPEKLKRDMGNLVLENMNSALLFFNLNGECIYSNKRASQWFVITSGERGLKKFLKQLRIDTESNNKKQIVRYITQNADKYFRTEYQRFEDEKHRYLGCFIQLEDITKDRIEQQEHMYLATHDKLTGLYNPNTFYAEAREIIDGDEKTQYSIITTNVRQFKILNDLLGWATGDELLKKIAETIRELLRDSMVAGRLGSDKFAICAPDYYHFEEKLSKKLQSRFEKMNSEYNISISVMNYYGVYKVNEPGLSIDAMCDRANMALNTIKADAVIQIAYYDRKLRNEMLFENQLVAEIPNALMNNQFVVYYQPQIDSRSNRIVGAEALVRWKHPESGVIMPGMFISLLEKSGLIYQLDQYVWERACQDLKILKEEGYDFPISVNISPRDVYSGDIYQIITELTGKYDLPEKSLNLEITESAIVLDMDNFIEILEKLQGRGFKIEMDDFGSGYSSLNTLKDIPVDIIKLDLMFLKEAKDQARSEKIMRMIVDLAKALDMPLIAEGVEKEEQVEFLKEAGCHNIQGYFYSKPLDFDEFRSYIASKETGRIA